MIFNYLVPGDPFLFNPRGHRKIAGGGRFVYSTTMTVAQAWDLFREWNGVATEQDMRIRHKGISANVSNNQDLVGCRILNDVFILDEKDWIDIPESFSNNIVSQKRYATDDIEVHDLCDKIERLATEYESLERFGSPRLVSTRIGQGLFRMRIVDAYDQKCDVTNERVLPALEASHIIPFNKGGEHDVSNGLLLRRDIHSLFDSGYVTVSRSYKFEVSDRIREEYENGKEYYALHDKEINLPGKPSMYPDKDALRWHKTNVYKG